MFKILKALFDHRIDYVLVGGLAVSLQGYQRVTLDVDIALAMDADNLRRFIDWAKSRDLHPVIPVSIDALADPLLLDRWHREKGMLSFGLREADLMGKVIDVLIRPVVPFADLKQGASIRHVGGITVPVASIDHLIAMKTDTGRGKDQIDIDELRKFKPELP